MSALKFGLGIWAIAGIPILAGRFPTKGGGEVVLAEEPKTFWFYVGLLLLLGLGSIAYATFSYWSIRHNNRNQKEDQ